MVERSFRRKTGYYFNEFDLPVRIVDALGEERQFSYGPNGEMEFEYDRAGQMTKRRTPGELEERFYYDACGRMIEQRVNEPGATLFLRQYKYDPEGNLIELADSAKGTSRFVYDPVERLREVTQPEKKVERFIYDRTGNLLRRGEREFHYDQPDRLTKADDSTLIYDDVGNLIEKRRGESVIRYSYDPDNRLIAVESEEGGRVEFAYDAFGRRIAKETKDGKVGFLWDGDVLLAEERGDRANEYIFDPGSFAPLCRFDREGFEAYHNDHLGTPRELTDGRGEVVWSARYDVYGRVDQLQAGQTKNQIRFQGQYEDQETGLHYNFYRYFDPDEGRYINKDPIGLLGGLNQYTYTHNPVNRIDPLGLIDPWDVYFSREPHGPEEVFQHGPWAGRTVGEAIEETRQLGRLPEGLQISGDWVHTVEGNMIAAAANNRTLYVAQEANLPDITIHGLGTNEGAHAVQQQFRLARRKGGSGFPIAPDDIAIRSTDC